MMKLTHVPLIGAAFLLGCVSTTTPTAQRAEGAYSLTRIEGTSIDGRPVNVVRGTLTLEGGVYDEEVTYSIWANDQGTVRDHGRYEVKGVTIEFTSERHFEADGPGEDVPRRQTGSLAGRDLVYRTPGWTYHYRRAD